MNTPVPGEPDPSRPEYDTLDFDPRTHRKRLRHYDEPSHAHELTFSCYKRLPLLTEPRRCRLLSQSIDRANHNQGFELIAFVYMPEHVHLIVFPIDRGARIAKLLFAIKRPFSTRVKQSMLESNNRLLQRLTIRERPGKTVFRFWQEGGGYDRNIGTNKQLQAAMSYVHNNPVRRGLCDSPENWQWSSWRYYFDPACPPDADLPTVHAFAG